MSKIRRRLSYPFTGDQPALTAIERRLVPSRDDIVAFYRTHERASWSLSAFLDIPPADIRVEALTETDIHVVESAMLVESDNPDYVANLIEYFSADEHACDFVMMWAIEEWKHYYVLRDYLAKVQTALHARTAPPAGDGEAPAAIAPLVDAAIGEKVGAAREESRANWGIPLHYLPVQVVASTSLQEFITAEFYRNHARQTAEPVLSQIEYLLAKDEARHEMFYERKLDDFLREDPGLLPLAVEALKEFTMPGAYLLDDYDQRRAAMEQAAFPTLAAKKAAFARLFKKLERMLGHAEAMRMLVEGNYFADSDGSGDRRRPRPALIARLITAHIAG